MTPSVLFYKNDEWVMNDQSGEKPVFVPTMYLPSGDMADAGAPLSVVRALSACASSGQRTAPAAKAAMEIDKNLFMNG